MLKRSEFLAGFGASLFVLSQGATAQPMPGGVLRVGLAHYNTEAEVDALLSSITRQIRSA